MRHTPSGGEVSVSARLSDETLLFSVADTGKGIAPSDLERIFEKFAQADVVTGGERASTGIGLTFCKMIVEAHGGHISVQSTVGRGSVFSFTMPLVKSQ